jgi:hypothetical protein
MGICALALSLFPVTSKLTRSRALAFQFKTFRPKETGNAIR